jgi:hypothetical protein
MSPAMPEKQWNQARLPGRRRAGAGADEGDGAGGGGVGGPGEPGGVIDVTIEG